MAGRRIDDHGSWVGAHGKNSVFPDGPHKVKTESSASTFGSLSQYEDTTESLKQQQDMHTKKVHSHGRKHLNRN